MRQSAILRRGVASRWCPKFGSSHEKVCHFVGTTFLCFQGVTREIALHGVSLNLVICEWWRDVKSHG
jgi:hypothetical protein